MNKIIEEARCNWGINQSLDVSNRINKEERWDNKIFFA